MNNILVYKGKFHPWLKMLEDSKVSFVALDPKNDKKLMKLLQIEPNWTIESEDEEFAFFTRGNARVESTNFI